MWHISILVMNRVKPSLLFSFFDVFLALKGSIYLYEKYFVVFELVDYESQPY